MRIYTIKINKQHLIFFSYKSFKKKEKNKTRNNKEKRKECNYNLLQK
jgi:hypothetical protein